MNISCLADFVNIFLQVLQLIPTKSYAFKYLQVINNTLDLMVIHSNTITYGTVFSMRSQFPTNRNLRKHFQHQPSQLNEISIN